MEKETTPITTRQEKLLKTVIVKSLTNKLGEHLNDKDVAKTFPTICEMAEEIVTEFEEMNLIDTAFKEIREETEEFNNQK